MLLNYLKSTSRQLFAHRGNALVSLAGLVLGMTGCILILLYVFDELNYDRWIRDGEAVYRYELQYRDGLGNDRVMRKAALRAGPDLQAAFVEIEEAVRIIDHRAVLGHDGAEYFETVWFADPAFPRVFSLDMLAGSTGSLADKSAILLSASAAGRYFGAQDPLGRVITLDGDRDYRVAAVFSDIPDRSHVSFDVIVPYDQTDPDYHFGYSDSWGAVEGYTYVKLAPGADVRALNAQLPTFLESRMPDFTVPPGARFEELMRPYLLNVRDIHLDPGGIGNIKPPGNRQILISLSLIAALVLVIAAINYINLSVIRCLGRAREMSVRKAVGARQAQIVQQLLCESVLVSLLALAVSLSLVELLLPLYNTLLDRDMTTAFLLDIAVLTELVFAASLIGGVSGLVPAARFRALRPAALLRGGGESAWRMTRSGWLQPVLVMCQFAITGTLVLATLVVYLQQAFLDDKSLGFNPEHKLVIRNLDSDFALPQRDRLATAIGRLPGVTGTAFSVATPADLTGAGFTRPVVAPGFHDEPLALYPKAVSPAYFDVYGVEFLDGRGFSAARTGDAFYWSRVNAGDAGMTTSSVVLNERAVSELGYGDPARAVGETLVLGNAALRIIGVVRDFHFQSLREPLTPNMYLYSPAEYPNLTVAYAASTDVAGLVAAINDTWDSLLPAFPIRLEFVADNLAAQYAQDRLQALLVAIFTSLSIIIAGMGLYALAAYSTNLRRREIGIRKAHGAQRSDIIGLFMGQFSKPVVVANILSWPVSLFFLDRYLSGYAYRIALDPDLFLLSALLTLVIAWAAVIIHTIRVAGQNPAHVLSVD